MFIEVDSRLRGFTIIELLVVIVVIAILAAITVTAYRGAEERAEIARITSAVNSYTKALALYRVDHGRNPAVEWACLGTEEDYPAEHGFKKGQCSSGSANNMWNEYLMKELRPYLSTMPSPRYGVRDDHYGGKIRGVIYDTESAHVSTDKQINGTITYYLKGDVTCPVGELRAYNPTVNITMCNAVIPTIS